MDRPEKRLLGVIGSFVAEHLFDYFCTCTGRGDLATLPVFETSEGLHVVFRLCHCHYLLVPLLADWLSSTVLASTTVSYLPVLKIWEHTCIGFICMAA